MANSTKKTLIESFIILLNEKPFDKITVQDIADHCGVNRNTFYYHFQDIYMLLEEILKVEKERVTKSLKNDSTWEEIWQEGMRFVLSNKRAVYHLYYSIDREVLENYLGDLIEYILRKYISLNYNENKQYSDILEFVIKFYKYGFVGILLEWIASGFSLELSEKFYNDVGACLDDNIINHFLKKS